jgi:peptidoglycan hydrolase CwlO-like protein
MKRKIFGSIILAAITLGISAPAVNAATETNDTQAVAISELNRSELEQVASEISVSKTELENLDENL